MAEGLRALMYFYKVKCLFFTDLGGLNGLQKPKSRSVNVLFMLLFSVIDGPQYSGGLLYICINGSLY